MPESKPGRITEWGKVVGFHHHNERPVHYDFDGDHPVSTFGDPDERSTIDVLLINAKEEKKLVRLPVTKDVIMFLTRYLDAVRPNPPIPFGKSLEEERLARQDVIELVEAKRETLLTLHGTSTGTLCSVCSEPQVNTPSGVTCLNGHGGAPAKETHQ